MSRDESREEVARKLCALTAERAGVEPSEVTEASRFAELVHFDSLDAVEYIMQVEDMFDVQITDEDAAGFEGFRTVGDVVDLVMRSA